MGSCAFCDDFKQWLAQPFSVDMPAVDWFLFIGLLLAVMVVWRFILRTVEEAIS